MAAARAATALAAQPVPAAAALSSRTAAPCTTGIAPFRRLAGGAAAKPSHRQRCRPAAIGGMLSGLARALGGQVRPGGIGRGCRRGWAWQERAPAACPTPTRRLFPRRRRRSLHGRHLSIRPSPIPTTAGGRRHCRTAAGHPVRRHRALVGGAAGGGRGQAARAGCRAAQPRDGAQMGRLSLVLARATNRSVRCFRTLPCWLQALGSALTEHGCPLAATPRPVRRAPPTHMRCAARLASRASRASSCTETTPPGARECGGHWRLLWAGSPGGPGCSPHWGASLSSPRPVPVQPAKSYPCMPCG